MLYSSRPFVDRAITLFRSAPASLFAVAACGAAPAAIYVTLRGSPTLQIAHDVGLTSAMPSRPVATAFLAIPLLLWNVYAYLALMRFLMARLGTVPDPSIAAAFRMPVSTYLKALGITAASVASMSALFIAVVLFGVVASILLTSTLDMFVRTMCVIFWAAGAVLIALPIPIAFAEIAAERRGARSAIGVALSLVYEARHFEAVTTYAGLSAALLASGFVISLLVVALSADLGTPFVGEILCIGPNSVVAAALGCLAASFNYTAYEPT